MWFFPSFFSRTTLASHLEDERHAAVVIQILTSTPRIPSNNRHKLTGIELFLKIIFFDMCELFVDNKLSIHLAEEKLTYIHIYISFNIVIKNTSAEVNLQTSASAINSLNLT